MADLSALALSRLAVSQALEGAGHKFPLAGRDDDVLGTLAYSVLCHAAAAYVQADNQHAQTHLLLAAFSLRANTDPVTFTTPLPSIACIPDGATFLRRLESIYHDLLWKTAEAATAPHEPEVPTSVGVLEYAALGLCQQMTLGLATELPDAADEAQRYRHFATLILELGAALATHDHRDEIVIRDLATAIIVDTADGGFEPLARVRLSQIADLTTYFSSMANNYSLAHNMDFLFKPAS